MMSPTFARSSVGRAILVALLGAAMALGVLEVGVRSWGFASDERWYPRASRESSGRPIRILFVGSSRVSASVDAERFARELGLAVPAGLVLNLGQGFSTIIEHHLGLQDLANRELLRGSLVFVEAPEGVPDASSWRDDWFFMEAPHFLLTVLPAGSLPTLWASNMDLEHKSAASGRFLFGWSRLITYRERLRAGGLARAYRAAAEAWEAAPWVVRSPPAEKKALNVRAEGGVRGDSDDLQRIRLAAVTEGRRMVATQRLIDDWTDTVVADLVRRVRIGGGQVIFFRVALSSVMRRASETAIGRENQRTFQQQSHLWGTPLLSVNHTYPDEDFPDLWHLSQERAEDFSRDLAQTWARFVSEANSAR